MSSHVIAHRGLDYYVTPTIDYDGRTVLDVEHDYAVWRSRDEALTVIEDLIDYQLGAPFWPATIPTPGVRAPDGLAAFLFGMHEDEIRAALEREIVDTAIAVEGATQ